MPEPIAYFLTWTVRGSWLPGDDRGWVDKSNNLFGTPVNKPAPLVETLSRPTREVATLSDDERRAVSAAIEAHAMHRGWRLGAVNVRTNHVHVVVQAPRCRPEIVMGQFKAWATRSLRELGLRGDERLWTREGSTRYLFDDAGLRAAVDYVSRHQD